MSIGQFRLGYRTLKTVLSVAICILIFTFFNNHSPVIACLSAIVALREDLSKTYSFGGLRVLGTMIGGFGATIYYFMQQSFTDKSLVQLILIPIFVGLLIIINDGLNLNKGIVASEATFLIIVFTIPQSESLLYIFERTFDSLIGVLVALSINRLVKPPTPPVEAPIDPRLQIEELQIELEKLKKDIQSKQE